MLIWELYGLFKFINAGTGPSGGRPGIFSIEARAKYDAWTRAAHIYDSEEAAKLRYLCIAESVGWKRGAGLSEASEPAESTAKGTGLGVSVSVMSQEDSGD